MRWMLANALGIVVGSLLGASNDGLVVSMLPRRPALILGDLVFGAAIGAAQWAALRASHSRSVPLQWILATSVGFTVGARSGARFAPGLVAVVPLPLSTAFGLCMGASVGLATAWVGVNALAWILGEGIAFSAGFSQSAVVFLALPIASLTWVGLEFVHRAGRPQR